MSSGHYNYLQHLISDLPQAADWQKLTLAVVAAGGLLTLGSIAGRVLARAGSREHVVPGERFSIFGFFDLFVELFVGLQDSILGKENRRYLSLTASLFIFILVLNLLGLIPGMPAATTTVWVNLGLAVVVFVAFNYFGIRENGLGGYLKHFCGPIVVLAPVVFLLEVVSTTLRLLTLNLRLYWNITADHIVLDSFVGLTKVIAPVFFYGLGTFVAFMQAFVFTVLTMIYILLATQHEEEH